MANLLQNGDFGAAPLSPTLLIGTNHAGKSAAQHWTTWNNTGPRGICAYTSTAIVALGDVDRLVEPPKDNPQTYCSGVHDFLKPPAGTKQVIEVVTNGADNGIVQVFSGDRGAPKVVESSVWVFVLRGPVAMGTGHGGNTAQDIVSTKTYEWELLHARNGVSPATEFIVYSAAAASGGAWFFAANASVVKVD